MSIIIDDGDGMKKLFIILVTVLLFLMTACTEIPIHTTDPIPKEPTEPNETPYQDVTKFYNSFGFSSLVLTDRSSIIEGFYDVIDEVEFLEALMNPEAKVIRILSDLSLGSLEVSEKLSEQGKELKDFSSVYRPHGRQALMHPTLIASGVGHVRIVDRKNLMIYSDSGFKIKHAAFMMDRSENIIIRNLHFSELWEWDEESRGQYKRNDWDYFTIEESKGIWFDHLTFDNVYDGIIDVKEKSSDITLSWSKLNFKPNDFVDAQIDDLELNMSNRPYYKELRDEGISVEDIKLFASFQKKGFNLGNTTDGSGFESITMTFHHLEVYNLMDRMPRLRKGDVHLYHVIVDNKMLYDLRLKLNSPNLSFVNQSIVSTEQGAILMEHSILKYVTTPIKNHQDSSPDPKYTGSYRVVNSQMILSNRQYFGSSDDRNSLWVHTGSEPIRPFVWRNFEDIPYRYQLEDIYFLPEIFETYPTGAQYMENFNWLLIDETLHIKGD